MVFDYTDPLAAAGVDPTVSLRAQLKTWTGFSPDIFSSSASFSYALKNKNLSKLNYNNPTEHKILILMLLPAEPRDWIAPQPTQELLRGKCFWVNLRGVPLSGSKPESTTTIQVPIGNVFDDVALCAIMQTIRNGGIPQ